MRALALVTLFFTSVAYADGVSWRTQAYARPGAAFEGSVSGVSQAAMAKLVITPAVEEFKREVDGENLRFSFVVPESESSLVEFSLSDGDEVVASHQVPIVNPQEFDITGDAAIELEFEVEHLNGRAVFVPCCTIYSGLLTAFTVPTNPVNNSAGLPEHLELPFSVLEPDQLAATTSGLALELNYGEPPAPGLKPVVMSYNRRTSEWAPIADAKHYPDRGAILIQCPNGGWFIVGWIPGSDA